MQAAAEAIGVDIFEQSFNLAVGLLPDRHRRGKQLPALRSQAQPPATSVGGIFGDYNQAAPLKRFERGCEGGTIHGKESCNGCHTRRFRAIERHHEGKLAVGQADRAQRLIEAASQGTRRPLHMQTQTAVANAQSSFKRN